LGFGAWDLVFQIFTGNSLVKIYIGADHNGFKLKQKLTEYLGKQGYEVVDAGDTVYDPEDDFPHYGASVATSVLGDEKARGILLCGSGQGVCIAANRHKGIRATLAWNQGTARAARNDDDSNVLCLPAREIDEKEAKSIVDAWLSTPFSAAPRFVRRNRQLDELS
jgi:ribose 5-phosphate isomerase B